jgi:hypothetical protein
MIADDQKRNAKMQQKGNNLIQFTLRFVWKIPEDVIVCWWRGSPASTFENLFLCGRSCRNLLVEYDITK